MPLPTFCRLRIPAALAAVAMLAGACSSDPTRGYSFTSTYSAGIHTVSVPIFDNQTYYKGLEVELTDALIKEIQRTTPWVVVSGSSSQATLTGTITDANLRTLSINSTTGMVQEMGMELSADFEFRDIRTGKVLTARKSFHAMESFVPAHPTAERIELGQHGSVQELARCIVAELRSGW
jgi:hypothetical protein